MIGTVIEGRYEIEKRIGRGGFGTVYRSTDLKLKRQVALKILEAFDASGDHRRRFERESEAMARLSHPNIVTVYDCGEFKGVPYLVMEYVNGPTLLDVVNGSRPAIGEVLTWARQICEGMAHAHSQGFVHRDLTLRNIMLQSAGDGKPQVRILDFGLARLADAVTASMSGQIQGTPHYLSPEQVNNKGVDARTDIFSFGVCLYRMLCGEFPFAGEHLTAVIYQVLTRKEFDFPPEIPAPLQRLILHCLEKDPNMRPQSFETIGQELAVLAAGTDSMSTTVSVPVPAVHDIGSLRSSRRNPYLNRVMIRSASDFFGREREVRKIFARLDAPHPQSISVVGERRIGKSSLLNYVYNRGNRRKHMTRHDEAIFVYLDFQHDPEYNIGKFIDYLFTAFAYELQGSLITNERNRTLEQLKAVIQEIMILGRRIVVLMDEFEVITRNRNFDADFFSFLRAMANSHKVAYVTSSCLELQALCHNQDIADSPFFNIFSNLPLKPFSAEDARDLITIPSRREGLELTPYTDRIIGLAGYRPMFLQMACSALLEDLLTRDGGEPDWDEVETAYKEEGHPHYEALWDRLEPNEHDVMARLARGDRIGRKHGYVLDALARQGFVCDEGQTPAVCSTALRDFVAAKTLGTGAMRRRDGGKLSGLKKLLRRG